MFGYSFFQNKISEIIMKLSRFLEHVLIVF